jgi:hypothetical protein
MASLSTPTRQQAEAAVRGMKGELRSWLKFRGIMNDYVAGKRQAPKLLRNPGARPLPPAVVGQTLSRERFAGEQDLAETLYGLLCEMGLEPRSLPRPDVSRDPDAAAKLAQIAIAGKTPSEAASPSAQGLVWFVLAIPVAGIVLIISQMIKSKAEVQKEQERLRCIESGACTDSGFWLKVGGIAITAWLVWDKFGLREVVERRTKKK